MDDLIYRREAIDALWKALYEYEDKTEKQFLESEELNTDDWFQHRVFVQNMSGIDIQTILNLPSAQQWIPCSEILPNKDGNYIVTLSYTEGFKFSFVDIDNFSVYEHQWDVYGSDVIAWMPLPQAWEGE